MIALLPLLPPVPNAWRSHVKPSAAEEQPHRETCPDCIAAFDAVLAAGFSPSSLGWHDPARGCSWQSVEVVPGCFGHPRFSETVLAGVSRGSRAA